MWGIKSIIFFLFLTVTLPFSSFSQEKDTSLVQFSGVILTADSLAAIPYAHIIDLSTGYGSVSDYQGYFSFVARKKDTIQFTAVGFKKEIFYIPDTISEFRYSMIQVMANDTVYLSETIIYPWPTKDQFIDAFLTLEIPDDDLEVARQNLDQKEIYLRAQNFKPDGGVNSKYVFNDYVDKLYYNGQTQPITLLNPFAWAAFIKAWKDGKFKRKYKNEE